MTVASSLLLVTVVIVAGMLLSYLAATRAAATEGAGFTANNLAGYGYGDLPVFVQYAIATLGIIGESAMVSHAVTPEILPEAGFSLLISDVFSPLPAFSETVTEHTISVYQAAGSQVFVSRPGGAPTTFYLLGGRTGVALGGFVYGAILMGLLNGVYGRASQICGVFFLILGATLVLGAYGTGTPTALTLLSICYAALLVGISHLFGRPDHVRSGE
ncbi:hypothetical protein QEN35_21640 [Gordonia alkanivorans]|uniref:hypothetical protein n=1 Tax=Gordonia alkanivorans TaxID=84096 RepID=UPI00244C2040|nr:hypothetical protein [Gordonia alkanivorans]MDH3026962.1 hypothetical protein [Gordonia alkanivorans]